MLPPHESSLLPAACVSVCLRPSFSLLSSISPACLRPSSHTPFPGVPACLPACSCLPVCCPSVGLSLCSVFTTCHQQVTVALSGEATSYSHDPKKTLPDPPALPVGGAAALVSLVQVRGCMCVWGGACVWFGGGVEASKDTAWRKGVLAGGVCVVRTHFRGGGGSMQSWAVCCPHVCVCVCEVEGNGKGSVKPCHHHSKQR